MSASNRGARLCMDCGLCCDGTLFSTVSLDDEATSTARLHHLPILETESGYHLELPCAALRGVLCEIYEERPETCSDFVCQLVTDVEDGLIGLGRARRVIDETRRVRDAVVDQLGGERWWRARRFAQQGGAHRERLEALEELHRLVSSHFW